MLKLLKYEFRKTLFPKLVLLGLTAAAEIVFLYGYFAKAERSLGTGTFLLVMLAMFGMLAIGLFSLMSLHRDMNTRQGYMLFMTPNSCYRILGAKVLECGLSLVLAGAFFFAVGLLDVDLLLMREGVERVWDMIRQFLQMLDSRLSVTLVNMLSVMCYVVFAWLCTVLCAFLADVVSAALLNGRKFNLLLTFVLFLVLNWGVSRLLMLVPASMTVSARLFTMSAVALGASAVMYYVTALIMERRLSV